MKWLIRTGVIADWVQILNAGAAIGLVWSGAHYTRWELTLWFAAYISSLAQLQSYRRWLDRAHRWLDESHDRERWYSDRW